MPLGFYGLDSFTGGSGGYPVIPEDDITPSTVTKSTMAFDCQIQVSVEKKLEKTDRTLTRQSTAVNPKASKSLCRALAAGEVKGSSLPSGQHYHNSGVAGAPSAFFGDVMVPARRGQFCLL